MVLCCESFMQQITMKVRGRVQGVFFRAHTREKAVSLGLTGFVKNAPDGSVEIVAEGDHKELDALEGWCRRGPPLARVTQLEATRQPATGKFKDFRIA